MKVLIVSAFNDRGGASIAANRLLYSLKDNIDCKMLVKEIDAENQDIICNSNSLIKIFNKFTNRLENLYLRLSNKPKHNFSYSFFGSVGIVKMINNYNPDIVNLHWVCDNTLSIRDISKIKAPIVWTLHDNWPFSDGHHTFAANNFNDFNKQINKKSFWLSYKKKLFDLKKNIFVVGPSKWICENSKSSKIFADREHFHIPNPVDINTFKPIFKNELKQTFDINDDEKLIVFGGNNPLTDPNKGFNLLADALTQLKPSKCRLLVYGVKDLVPKKFKEILDDAIILGKVSDNKILNQIYNLSDLIAVPSFHENLSNTILESLSSGAPVVAFKIGGNAELIDHKKNGYLAKPYDSSDLARGIDWILSHHKSITHNCSTREKITSLYSYEAISSQYINLFSDILNTD